MSKTNYAWDSTVVIAWLSEEASAPLDDMQAVVEEIDGGTANLIFSVLTFSEILESKYTADQLRNSTSCCSGRMLSRSILRSLLRGRQR